MNKKYLIVNSDDYNLTEGVSRGISHSSQEGIVTSTTFMANLPIEKKTLSFLSNRKMSVGIHFNFTYGKPVSEEKYVSSLVDEEGKFFRSFRKIAKKTMEKQILREVKAQYCRFLDTGLKPSHFDSHHHVHSIPELQEIFFDFSMEMKLPIRSLNGFHRKEANSRNLITPQSFYDDFYGEKATLETIENILSSLPRGVSELMCHPGYADPVLDRVSSYNDYRVKELEVLTSPDLLKLIKAFNIELISYSELAKIYV